MTPEFEHWADAEAFIESDENWRLVSPLSRKAAHYWATAIVFEIEKEASEDHTSPFPLQSAFYRVKRRFGLGGTE